MKLKALPSDSKVRVWFPVPQTDKSQIIGHSTFEAPSRVHLDTEPVHGNKMAYFEAIADASGTIEFQSAYDVKRSEVRALDATRKSKDVGKLSDRERSLYLSANKRVPIDGKPISFRGKRIAAPTEEAEGWNQMEPKIEDGTVEVTVNGKVVNRASDCPTTEAMLTLRNEGTRVEFRDLLLIPLD